MSARVARLSETMFGNPVIADLAEVAFLRTSFPREQEERDRDADNDADNDPYGHAEVPSDWHDKVYSL